MRSRVKRQASPQPLRKNQQPTEPTSEPIETANRHNILCHCRRCGLEWIDSTFEAICQCGSSDTVDKGYT